MSKKFPESMSPHKPADPARRAFSLRAGLVTMLPLMPWWGGGIEEAGRSPRAQKENQAGTDEPGDALAESAARQQAPAPAAAMQPLAHPGLLHTNADLQRMRDKVAANEQPWLGGWNMLLAAGRSNLGATPFPLEIVTRGVAGENYWTMIVDMMRAYHLALRWKITGIEAYAKDAVKFLNAWSSTLKGLGGNSNLFLSSGLYGNQWANAAELMRTYSGWAKEDVARFQSMLLNVFYTRCHDFLLNHNGTETRKVTHYWANWDLANLCGMYAIGVFCDRPDIAAEAINYYKTGRGNGAADHSVYFMHPGYLGQWQESHRDQGHSTLGIALAGMLCEMAWNQGEDLFGYANNRLLAGAEYVAKTNLSDPSGNPYKMPFTPYDGVHGAGTATAGSGSRRPCWELIYNHYVNRKGLSAPWTKAIVEQVRPERSDGGDSVGLGTLFFTQDAAPAAKPSGLSACLNGGKVLLSWWGSADATLYSIQRAASPDGPFTTLAQVNDPRTYTDAPARGTWYYRISAATALGERVGAETVRVAVPGELWLRLPLNGNTDDVSGYGRHAQLVGGASWGQGRMGGSAIQLDGKSGHVRLPDGAVSTLGDFTIAVWVYWDNPMANARIFDFGSNDVAYMALCPRDRGPDQLRFLASRNQFWPEQPLSSNMLPSGRWVHVAVTLSGTLGTLYVDGSPVASHDEIWMAPYQFGNTVQTWLGRSQYGGDPFFKGRMQDFRIYAGALAAGDIAGLAADPATSVPNLQPTITSSGAPFAVGESRDVILNINEVNGAATSGLIQFLVPYSPANFIYTFDPTRTTGLINGAPQAVNNDQWAMTPTAAGMLFSNSASNLVIAGGGRSRVVISARATQPGGTATVNVYIQPYSGGEAKINDNTVSIQNFVQ